MIKKKKLEFAADKHLKDNSDSEEEAYEKLSLETMKTLIAEKKEKRMILERYQAEKEELINLTERWKKAGLDGIERLRNFVDPSKTDEEILDNFNIPHEVFLS